MAHTGPHKDSHKDPGAAAVDVAATFSRNAVRIPKLVGIPGQQNAQSLVPKGDAVDSFGLGFRVWGLGFGV